MKQTASGTATGYLCNGSVGVPVEQFNASGAGNQQFYFADAHGSTVALTSSTGAVDGTWAYSPWGAITVHTGDASTPILYAGAYADAETGLLYLQARYYDPTTALFLTVDPLVDLTHQAYLYTDDDPLNRTDPTGLWWGAACIGFDVSGYLGFGGGVGVSGCVGWSSGSGLIATASASAAVGYGAGGGGDVFAAAEGGSEDTANQLSGTDCTVGAGGSAAIGISVTGAGECGESPSSAEIDFSGGGDFGWDVNAGLSNTCVWAPFGNYAGCSNANQDSPSSVEQSPSGWSSSGTSGGSSPQGSAPEYGSTVRRYYATSANC